jgi:hypothetical protein
MIYYINVYAAGIDLQNDTDITMSLLPLLSFFLFYTCVVMIHIWHTMWLTAAPSSQIHHHRHLYPATHPHPHPTHHLLQIHLHLPLHPYIHGHHRPQHQHLIGMSLIILMLVLILALTLTMTCLIYHLLDPMINTHTHTHLMITM